MTKVAILTTDSREHYRDYQNPAPYFGMAPEALLQGLAKLPDIEVHVISCLRKPVASPDKLALNIWYHGLHVSNSGWMKTGYQGCIRAVRKRLKYIQPDIVHGQGTERDCVLGAVFSGFPNVATIHGNMAELARLFHARIGSFGWLAARLENFALKRTAGVFCNSAYTERLVEPRAKRVWRVSNPVREEFFKEPTRTSTIEKCILVNVGLISERKRQVELLDLAKNLHERGLNFELHFVGHAAGGGNYTQTFLDRIKEAERKGYARYLGPKSTSELIALFDGASAMIHFPSEEAFGLVVPEALARELKFFGSDVGGIRDIAAGIQGAELFEMNGWPALTEAVFRWINGGFQKPSGAAEIMRKRYHPEVIARRHLDIYREVLSTVS